MHHHCEIVMPPTDDIEGAVRDIMKPFSENDEENYDAFWDFYVIGGRFAGSKQLAVYDKEKLDAFYQWLRDEKVTVSGFQCGKPQLSPPGQRIKVDDKWNEMFTPEGSEYTACPLFCHSNDQYGRDGIGTISGDIQKLADISEVECSRVIIAGPSWNSETKEHNGPIEATFMLCDTQWNGVNHMPVDWDGKVSSAISQFTKKLKHYRDKYREVVTPKDNWLVVTVDYHS